MGEGEWFRQFCNSLSLDPEKRSAFAYRTARITRALNKAFRDSDSETANRFYVGSMGRNTAIPSVSDVDLLYELPSCVYATYNSYAHNGQSALLSAVRQAIRTTYSRTEVSADGQVVVVEFEDGVKYEVLPAFRNQGGGYTFADSNNGGRWRTCKPKQEMDAFAKQDNAANGNLVRLGRMVRAWRDTNNVPMGGMLIDTLAYRFIDTWPHRDKSFLYYDFLTRDFFKFLANQDPSQDYWAAPGSSSFVPRKGSFEFKARQAHLRALEAIDHIGKNENRSAKQKFRAIYGNAFPA